MTPGEYNDDASIALQKLQYNDINLSEDELDILELFAQAKSLTIMEITSNIEHTKIQRKYKNVYYLVHKLESSKLVEKEIDVQRDRRRHNERYFKITDTGIHQLFLRGRHYGILTDQLSVKRGKTPISNIETFLMNHGNNEIFNLFLYPFFEKHTIFDAGSKILGKLFRYLFNCCKAVEAASKISYMIPQFSWDKVPGEASAELLSSLEDVLGLDHLNDARIEKTLDHSTVKVFTSQIEINIRLDSTKGTAIARVDIDNKPRKFEYKMLNYFSEIVAFRSTGYGYPLNLRKLVEVPIYELINDIESEPPESQSMINGLLANDTKFMTILNDMHERFDKNYKLLEDLRKES